MDSSKLNILMTDSLETANTLFNVDEVEFNSLTFGEIDVDSLVLMDKAETLISNEHVLGVVGHRSGKFYQSVKFEKLYSKAVKHVYVLGCLESYSFGVAIPFPENISTKEGKHKTFRTYFLPNSLLLWSNQSK